MVLFQKLLAVLYIVHKNQLTSSKILLIFSLQVVLNLILPNIEQKLKLSR